MAKALIGDYGEPVDTAVLTEEIAGPTVTGVRTPIAGHPAQGLTPQRLASILLEAETGEPMRYLELAEEMEEKDLHYVSVLGTRKRQVAQLDITVNAASDAAEDVKNAELVQAFVDREALEDELVDILDAVGKGFSATEVIWDMSERQWVPARLEWRDPRWFTFDRTDLSTLMLRGDDGQPVPLPGYKFIVHQHKAKSGLPIRGGIARAAAWAYLFKNYNMKDWVAFAEVYGQPIRVGKYHPSATPEEKAVLLRAVRNIGSDAAAIIPQGMEIEFVRAEAARETGQLYKDLADWLDQQVSKAVLGQTTTTDAISGGHAVSKEHNEVRRDIERSDAKQLAAVLNRCIVRPIVDLNRGPQKAYPWITIERPEQADIVRTAEALSKLVPVGLKIGQRQVLKKIGFDEPEDDDELLGMQAVPQPALGRARARTAPARPSDPADDIADQLEALAAPATDAAIDAVRELVETSASMQEISEGLLRLYPQINANALADKLREALVLAELAGRSDIVDGS